MRISDCKEGDWLVIRSLNDKDLHEPTACVVDYVGKSGVIVKFNKDVWGTVLLEQDNRLRSNGIHGDDAIRLIPFSFQFHLDECNITTPDGVVTTSHETGWKIAAHYEMIPHIPTPTKDKPKLNTGDRFVFTRPMMLAELCTQDNETVDNMCRYVDKELVIKRVTLDQVIRTEYYTIDAVGTSLVVWCSSIDPYLVPEEKVMKLDPPKLKKGDKFLFTQAMFDTVAIPHGDYYRPLLKDTCVVFCVDNSFYHISSTKDSSHIYHFLHHNIDNNMLIDWTEARPSLPGGVMKQGTMFIFNPDMFRATECRFTVGAKYMVYRSCPEEGGYYIGEKAFVKYEHIDPYLPLEYTTKKLSNLCSNNMYDTQTPSCTAFSYLHEKPLSPKPSFMTRLLSKLKKLRMSKDDKDLLAAGFIDENGDPTQDGLYAYSVILFDEKEVRAKLAEYARKIKEDRKEDECCCD
jgi:hypothetical protein